MPCTIRAIDKDKHPIYKVAGFADVVKDGAVYELKFVSELSHSHFLQCALYMIALQLDKGILWNVRNNDVFEIRIQDQKQLLDTLTSMLTSERQLVYRGPLQDGKAGRQRGIDYRREALQERLKKYEAEQEAHKKAEESRVQQRIKLLQETKLIENAQLKIEDEMFAVVDVETTWADVRRLIFGEKYKDAVFSVGVIIANAKNFKIVRALYLNYSSRLG